MNRRSFLQSAAAWTAAAVAGRAHAEPDQPRPGRVAIDEPFHGAVVNRRQGRVTAEGLAIQVRGQAPAGWPVTVNGAAAARSGGRFEAQVVLREQENDIVAAAVADGARREDRVRVVWDRHSFPRYRFSIDDNSFFLRDVAQKQYKSLFDCFYLDILRKLNQKYGAKFVLNIYYTTGDDFNLTQFPDRYKGQWKDNAGWLRLAFHAHADKPDRPYQDAEPARLVADLDKVAGEIRRFAGEEVYSPPTVIHWGMTRHTAFKPLYERGVRVLSGYFEKDGQGLWDVNYLWDDRRSAHLNRHDAWKDFDSGLVFSKIDIVCNSVPVDKIVPKLAPLTKDADTAEIMDLFTCLGSA